MKADDTVCLYKVLQLLEFTLQMLESLCELRQKYCCSFFLDENMTCKYIKTWFYKSEADSLEVAGEGNIMEIEALSFFP